MYRLILLSFLLLPSILSSQRINNRMSYRNMGDSYIRLSYDNDYFTKTDRYYTQGINLEYINPILKKNPLNILLLKSNTKPVRYGIAADHFGFTPTSIRSNEILVGDRPFAGCLSVKSFNIITDTERNNIYTSSITLGVIGPWAGGEGMQKGIHRAIGDQLPLGWQHQIRNDVIVNYEVAIEKQIYAYYDSFVFNISSGINAGTLSDKIHAGFNFRLGKLNPLFISEVKNNFQFYMFGESIINGVGYDATMQGGIFNRTSPHTIGSKDIRRFTFQQNFGCVLNFKKLYFEYYQSLLSPEFRNGKMHRWGGLKIGVVI